MRPRSGPCMCSHPPNVYIYSALTNCTRFVDPRSLYLSTLREGRLTLITPTNKDYLVLVSYIHKYKANLLRAAYYLPVLSSAQQAYDTIINEVHRTSGAVGGQ